MRIIKKSLLTVAILGAMTASFGTPVANYFVNGVGNTRLQADNSAGIFQEEVSVGNVGFLYNRTFGEMNDVLESATQVLNLDNFYGEDGGVNGENLSVNVWLLYRNHVDRTRTTDVTILKLSRLAKEMMLSDGQDMTLLDSPDLNQFYSDLKYIYYHGVYANEEFFLAQSKISDERYFTYADYLNLKDMRFKMGADINISKLVSVVAGYGYRPEMVDYFAPDSMEYFDINNMLIELHSEENSEKNINVISHSQGNLFANRLLDAFGQPDRVKLLSVATPDDRVYNVPSYDWNNNYVTLDEDIVAKGFIGELPDNESNLSDEEWDDVNSALVTLLDVNKAKYRYIDEKSGLEKGDFFGHGFVTAYLHKDTNGIDSKSKQFIVSKFQQNYNSLASAAGPDEYGTGGEDME